MTEPKSARGTTLGFVPVIFYNLHAAYWIFRGGWENSLWACHVASLLIGAGMIFGTARLVLTGMLWLVIGNAFWILYLGTGGEFLPTSLLTHAGSFVIGLVGLNRFGVVPGTWWRAALGLIPLHLAARFTPPAENVNLAHRVDQGWASVFPVHSTYVLFVFALCLVTFFVSERLFRKIKKG